MLVGRIKLHLWLIVWACFHMSVDDWYWYWRVERFHCKKLSLSNLQILDMLTWGWLDTQLSNPSCCMSTRVPLFLGQNAPNALHMFGPFVTAHITCYGEGKWLRFLAIDSFSAKKKWQSTPHVLICGFKSNGISMMAGWCCWKYTYISWNHQKGRPLHICTTKKRVISGDVWFGPKLRTSLQVVSNMNDDF